MGWARSLASRLAASAGSEVASLQPSTACACMLSLCPRCNKLQVLPTLQVFAAASIYDIATGAAVQ